MAEREAPRGSIDEIRQLEERLLRGDADPDPDTSSVFDELLADDVLFVQAHGNSMVKAGVLQGHRPPHKRSFSKVENVEMEIRDLGSTVAVSSRTNYVMPDRSSSIRALCVWKPVDGSWKVAVVALMGVPGDDG